MLRIIYCAFIDFMQDTSHHLYFLCLRSLNVITNKQMYLRDSRNFFAFTLEINSVIKINSASKHWIYSTDRWMLPGHHLPHVLDNHDGRKLTGNSYRCTRGSKKRSHHTSYAGRVVDLDVEPFLFSHLHRRQVPRFQWTATNFPSPCSVPVHAGRSDRRLAWPMPHLLQASRCKNGPHVWLFVQEHVLFSDRHCRQRYIDCSRHSA